MKLKKVDISIYTGKDPRSEKEKLVDDFIKSGFSVAEVDGWKSEYANVDSAYGCIYQFTRKHNCDCRPFIRSGKLYLVNTTHSCFQGKKTYTRKKSKKRSYTRINRNSKGEIVYS